MKIENEEVFNFKGAFRGMRNPLDSWDKSDSEFSLFNYEPDDDAWEIAAKYAGHANDWWELTDDPEVEKEICELQDWLISQGARYERRPDGAWSDNGWINYIGPDDMRLAQKLIAAGPEHRKFMRQIFVSVDITAPLYWWKEFDTYKVATVSNSCSTMHKLTSHPITIDCFETDDYESKLIFEEGTDDRGDNPWDYKIPVEDVVGWNEDHFYYTETIIGFLESLRQKYLETKDKRYWKELVRWLPNSWLQKRTITMNYETLRAIWSQRHNHKLTEWHTFCHWIETLPYAEDLILHKLKSVSN